MKEKRDGIPVKRGDVVEYWIRVEHLACNDVDVEPLEVGIIDLEGDVTRVPDFANLAKDTQRLLSQKLPYIVLDMSKAQFVSASICGFLASAVRQAQHAATRLIVVAHPNSLLYKILRASNLPRMMDVCASTCIAKSYLTHASCFREQIALA